MVRTLNLNQDYQRYCSFLLIENKYNLIVMNLKNLFEILMIKSYFQCFLNRIKLISKVSFNYNKVNNIRGKINSSFIITHNSLICEQFFDTTLRKSNNICPCIFSNIRWKGKVLNLINFWNSIKNPIFRNSELNIIGLNFQII